MKSTAQLIYRKPIGDPAIGERIRIIPNHCCVVSNIADSVWLVRDGQVVGEEKVAARGKVI